MKLGKTLKAGLAALVTALLLLALPSCVVTDTRTSDLNFDFNEWLMPIYRTLHAMRLDFFNVDFREFDMEYGQNFGIVRAAEWFLDYETDVNVTILDAHGTNVGMTFVDAEELGIFIMEAFGIELPLVSVHFHENDFYEFVEDMGVFRYPGANGGWGSDRWLIDSYTENADGSITLIADLYTFGLTDAWPELEAELAKPKALWRDDLNWGRNARSEITIIVHEEYEFFPMQLVSIQTERHDWDEAGGTYMSEDGAFILSFGLDHYYRYEEPYYDFGRLNVLFTDTERELDFWMYAYIYLNIAEIYAGNYKPLESFITLFPDGSIYVSAFVDLFGVDFSGRYERISDDMPPPPAMIGFEWERLYVFENSIGSLMFPHISRMGDPDFYNSVQQHIYDIAVAAFVEFVDPLEEADFGEHTRFEIDMSIVAVSDFYYALAMFTHYYIHGAAHGNYSFGVFNIDAERELILTLDDVFVDGYRPILEGILNEMAGTDEFMELLFPDTEITVDTDTVFFITGTEVVIIFQPYEVGPFSSGIIRFVVPISEITDILREEYQGRGITRQISDTNLFREYTWD